MRNTYEQSKLDIPGSTASVGKTSGYLLKAPTLGFNHGIVIVDNENAPEIPYLQIFEEVNWKYLQTEFVGKKVRYTFELEDKDSDKLRTVIWFMDTLYG